MKAWAIIAIGAAGILAAISIGRTMVDDMDVHSFKPIHKLATWYTDRNPVDIAIVGASGASPEYHRVEPDRVLRFRLERAYVSSYSHYAPGSDYVYFGFDMETGLPSALFDAVASRGQFHEDFEGVPVLTPREQSRRFQSLQIESKASAAELQRQSETLRRCVGSSLGDGLHTYEVSQHCWKSALPDATLYLAEYEKGLLLRLQCRGKNWQGFGCSMKFPFEGFAVKVSFHQDHRTNWREMITRAESFLKSKQFKG